MLHRRAKLRKLKYIYNCRSPSARSYISYKKAIKSVSIMLAFCLLTVIATLAAGTPTPEPPNGIPQCARSECPVYTELEVFGPDMWKRRIEPGLWLRRVAPTCNVSDAVMSVYLDLNDYFTVNGIARTTPIILEFLENKAGPSFCPDQSDAFPCCEEIYALLFYIPEASQATAPLPSNVSALELVNMTDPREFYGINFDEQATMQNVNDKYNELAEFLNEQGIQFEDDTYLVASYDAPWRPLPHRNEIMFPIKKDKKKNDNTDRNGSGRGDGGRGDDGRGGGRRGRRQSRSIGIIHDIDIIPF